MLVGLPAWAWAQVPVTIDIVRLICLEETDEVGSDEPYLVAATANLRTGPFRVESIGFGDVDQGEVERFSLNIARWEDTRSTNEIVVQLMMLESDQGAAPFVFDENAPNEMRVGYRVDRSLQQMAGNYLNQFRQNPGSRNHLARQLHQHLLSAAHWIHDADGDDYVNIVEVRFVPSEFSTQAVRQFERTVEINGDGGRYLVVLRVQSGEHLRSRGQAGEGSSVNESKKQGTSEADMKLEMMTPLDVNGQSNIGTQPNLLGRWTSNFGIPYEVTRHGEGFYWYAEPLRQSGIIEYAGDLRVTGRWREGAQARSAQGKVVVDGAGRAIRIEWDHGVVFHR